VNNLLAVPYVEIIANSHSVFEAAVSEPEMASIEDINNAANALKAAALTYVADADPAEGNKFDLTFLLTNPDLTPFYTGGHGSKPEGWQTEQADGNWQVIPSEEAANLDGVHKYCYEYWSNPAKTNGLFNLYTTVNLPVGTYQMNCYAFARDQFAGTNTAGVYFYANNTQGSQVNSNTLEEQSVEFVNTAEQDVKIGLKPTSTNTYNWMGIGYIHLYKVPAKKFEIKETESYDHTQDGAGDVKLYREFHWYDYNTLVLPFNMSAEEVNSVFGPEAKVYYAESFENNVISLRKNPEGSVIKANTPCVILMGGQLNLPIEIPSRTLVPTTEDNPQYVGSAVTTIGNYSDACLIPQLGMTNWFIGYGGSQIESAALYYVDSEVRIRATQAYFMVEGATEAKPIGFSVDGQTTGIATIENGEINFNAGKVYDISGREVQNPTRGIYIVGGKKVMIK